MMRDDYTHITIVRDCSGSMEMIASDMDGGLNTFLTEHRKAPGKVTLSLYDFSTSGWWSTDKESPPVRLIHDFVDIKEIEVEPMHAIGGTPLLDAEGIAIAETGQRLAKMDEDDRPAKILVVIITDGEENQSKEYTLSQIKKMIKTQEDNYSWQFTFLGANQDAHASGADMNVKRGATMNFAPSADGVSHAFESLTAGSLRARGMSRQKYAKSVADGMFYTNAEQEKGDVDAKGSNSDDLQGSSS